jgi:hypothetical protein
MINLKKIIEFMKWKCSGNAIFLLIYIAVQLFFVFVIINLLK